MHQDADKDDEFELYDEFTLDDIKEISKRTLAALRWEYLPPKGAYDDDE
jgi:hypothetical protein